MRPLHQLETRAASVVEAICRGESFDDRLVHALASLPRSLGAAARLLAGQANAARGRDLLWLIGVDRTAKGERSLRGTDIAQVERWMSQLSDFFEGVNPRLQAFAIPLGGAKAKSGVAMLTETARAPFVVRRHGGKDLETPWFDGGAVRSATRLELVQLLSPLQDLPSFEVLDAELSVYKNPHVSAAARETFRWTLDATVYASPQGEARVIVPLHQCRGSVRIEQSAFRSDAADFSVTADKSSPAVRVTDNAALIEGLGRMFIYCCGSTREPALALENTAELLLDFRPAGAAQAATAFARLQPESLRESNQAGRWKL